MIEKILIVGGTTFVLVFYGSFLRQQLEAGHYYIIPLAAIGTLALVYWMSPEDRPTFHRAFRRVFGRRREP